MKKVSTRILLLLTVVAMSFTSCMKSMRHRGEDKDKTVTLDVSLNRGEIYNLDLSAYGDEDDLTSIQTQANDYVVSTINKTATFYSYQFQASSNPKTGAADAETVVLKVAEPANRRCSDQTIITIHFALK